MALSMGLSLSRKAREKENTAVDAHLFLCTFVLCFLCAVSGCRARAVTSEMCGWSIPAHNELMIPQDGEVMPVLETAKAFYTEAEKSSTSSPESLGILEIKGQLIKVMVRGQME